MVMLMVMLKRMRMLKLVLKLLLMLKRMLKLMLAKEGKRHAEADAEKLMRTKEVKRRNKL